MRTRNIAALSVAAGTVLGLAAAYAHEELAPSPVYFIGEIDVTDPDGYAKEYLPRAREIIKAHGGHLLAAGGASAVGAQVVPIDGDPPRRVVIYQYPSVEAVKAWRNDPQYEKVREVGEKYATYRTFAVEGLKQ